MNILTSVYYRRISIKGKFKVNVAWKLLIPRMLKENERKIARFHFVVSWFGGIFQFRCCHVLEPSKNFRRNNSRDLLLKLKGEKPLKSCREIAPAMWRWNSAEHFTLPVGCPCGTQKILHDIKLNKRSSIKVMVRGESAEKKTRKTKATRQAKLFSLARWQTYICRCCLTMQEDNVTANGRGIKFLSVV